MSHYSLWSPALDALTAAPKRHRLLFENANVRVLDTLIPPGERTPIHSHQWPAAHYVLSWSDFIRCDADGHVLVDTRATGLVIEPGSNFWGAALPPHSLENVGSTPLHIISTEVKATE